jgi:hypothetical protein
MDGIPSVTRGTVFNCWNSRIGTSCEAASAVDCRRLVSAVEGGPLRHDDESDATAANRAYRLHWPSGCSENQPRSLFGRQPITGLWQRQRSLALGCVGDVVCALVKLAHHPGAVGEVFNVGTRKRLRLMSWRLVRKMTGSKSEILHIPYDRAREKGFEDMPRRVPDVSKIQQLSLDLEGILARIIASIHSNERPEVIPTQEAASQPDSFPRSVMTRPARYHVICPSER